MDQPRIRALKGEGKTISRKARKSGRASGIASPAGSDVINKVFQHEDTQSNRSVSSVSPPSTPPAYDSDPDKQQSEDEGPFDHHKLASELQDRKNNQTETREELLDHYVKTLRRKYSYEFDSLDGQADELLGVFLRGANRGATPRERSLSLQAYYLTASFVEADKTDSARLLLKQILTDDDDEECQVHALYALTQTVVYSDGSTESIYDLLDFLIEAIQTNGDSINAIDKNTVMVTLFECWAFAASYVDLWSHADYAMDALVDKLDSTNPEIQAIASESIAFLFEASRTHEIDEGEPFQLPYDPQRIASRIMDMTKHSTKSRSRKDRRDLRESLRSVSTSLDRSVGPYYSTASMDHQNGEELGYRYKIRRRDAVGWQYQAYMKTWHTFHRYCFLRNLFKGGLERHIQNDNPMVMDALEGLSWSAVQKSDS